MSTLIVTGSPREGMYSDRMGEMYRKITKNEKLFWKKDLRRFNIWNYGNVIHIKLL